MPYFNWKGIDLTGTIRTGTERVRSAEHLDATLLNNDIALLQAHQLKASSLFRPISKSLRTDFFKQLALLLQANIFLDYALALLQQQIRNQSFGRVIEDINEEIKCGGTLSQAISRYPDLFDQVTIQLLNAGQESGNVVQALTMIADIGSIEQDFYNKVRKVVVLPFITLLFFFIISGIILAFIVPVFASMVASMGQSLPVITQWMLTLSLLIRSPWLLITGAMSIVLCLVLKKMYTFDAIKQHFDTMLLSIPGIGSLVKRYSLMYTLYSLSLLIQGKVPVGRSLATVVDLVHNKKLKAQCMVMCAHVQQGYSLSKAMQMEKIFTDDIIAIVHLGEESGHLGTMLMKAADIYKERINRILFIIATVVQPLLMIILGMLIMLMIVAIYMPIINLSYSIA